MAANFLGLGSSFVHKPGTVSKMPGRVDHCIHQQRNKCRIAALPLSVFLALQMTQPCIHTYAIDHFGPCSAHDMAPTSLLAYAESRNRVLCIWLKLVTGGSYVAAVARSRAVQ